ncbi:hypothetical protein GCM10007338_08010 [Corynebacterium pelargi]|nr:hypothetical protein GCM10007338_08010 [Corynebacterium pelargi]
MALVWLGILRAFAGWVSHLSSALDASVASFWGLAPENYTVESIEIIINMHIVF